MPTLSALLTGFASRLTELENYETQDGKITSINLDYCLTSASI